VKSLSNKNHFWVLILTLAPVFYTLDLFFEQAEFSLAGFGFYAICTVIGVLVGYFLSVKLLSKYQGANGFNAIGLLLLVTIAFSISVLFNLTSLVELQPFISKTLVMSLLVSAITFSSGASEQIKS